MDRKQFIWLGILVGSTIGGFVPDLWGAGIFSAWGIIFGGIGGIGGIWLAFRLSA